MLIPHTHLASCSFFQRHATFAVWDGEQCTCKQTIMKKCLFSRGRCTCCSINIYHEDSNIAYIFSCLFLKLVGALTCILRVPSIALNSCGIQWCRVSGNMKIIPRSVLRAFQSP